MRHHLSMIKRSQVKSQTRQKYAPNHFGGSEISVIARRRAAELGIEPDTMMVDSAVDLEITVRKSDLVTSAKHDKSHCVFAQAACRTVPGVAQAWMWKTSAWLHVVPDSGEEKFVHFVTSEAMKRAIKRFDATGEFVTGVYKLLAPCKGRTIEAARLKLKNPNTRAKFNQASKRKRLEAQRKKRESKNQSPKKNAVRLRTRMHWASSSGSSPKRK